MLLQLIIRNPAGEKTTLEINNDASVNDLKAEILRTVAGAPSEMRLVVRGKILNGDLKECSLLQNDVVYVVRQSSSSPQSSAPINVPETQKDPMESLMQSPMMQSMMENPAFMQSLFDSDPRFAKMVKDNPELRQVMSDPSYLKQLSSAVRNPKIMKEMMRNQDRALSNIEGIPGGFNQLSKLFSSMGENSSPDPSTDEANRIMAQRFGVQTSSPTEGPNVQALPNPWAAPPPTPVARDISNAGNGAGMNVMLQQMMGSGIGTQGGQNAQTNSMMQQMMGGGAQSQNAQNTQMNTMLQQMMGGGLGAQSNQNTQMNTMIQQMMGGGLGAQGNQGIQNTQMNTMMQQIMGGGAQNNQQMNALMQQMLQGDPQLDSMMQQMMNVQPSPATNSRAAAPNLNTMMQQLASLGALGGGAQTANMANMNPFMRQLGIPSGAMRTSQINPVQLTESIETRFSSQLASLHEMGFVDDELNKRALLAAGGNTEAAIAYLLEQR